MSQPRPDFSVAFGEIDRSHPSSYDERGRPVYTVRSRIAFTIGTSALRDAVVRPASSSAAPVDTRASDCAECSGTGMKGGEKCSSCDGMGKMSAPAPETRAAGDGPVAGPKIRGPRLEGVASSTGRDCYGTEMSRPCLDHMAAQFRSGSVVYLPAHPSWSGNGGEWDDVMGYVFDGTVERGEVADNTNPGEFSYILRVGVQLDEKHPKAMPLAERVADGHAIGQSIGGWFTKLSFVWPEGTDDDEKWWTVDPERIVVEEVELDHLAATRRPANVESWIDGVRSGLRDFGTRMRAGPHRDAARAIEEASRTAAPPAASEPVVRAEEPAPEPPEAAPEAAPEPAAEPAASSSEERSESPGAPPLDTAPSARHATDEPTSGSDAREALPLERHEPSLEPAMTPEEIARIASEAAVRAVTELEARRASAAPSPAPAAEAAPAARAEDAETVRLREENARLRSDLQGALAAPVRRGIVLGHFPADRSAADAETNALLSTLDTENRGRRLGAVLRSRGFMDRRTEAEGAGKVQKRDLEGDLRSVIGAACDDGLIRTDVAVSWA